MAKVALITGSAVRIGREIASHLADGGWDLALHYSTSSKVVSDFEAELKSTYPHQHFCTFQADFSKTDQTQNLINHVVTKFGNLVLLINNASVFEPASLKETSSDLLMQQMTVNSVSPFILMRDFANIVNNGLIINILDSKITNNKSDYFAYALSKKSLWELTKMAALELAPDFRVNAIAPGAVLSPVGKDRQYLENIAWHTPLKIPSGVIPILRSIDYIIENQDLTGQLLYCDGGAHLL